MIARLGTVAANILMWCIVILLAVLPGLVGSAASLLAVLMALLLTPVLLAKNVRDDLVRQPALQILLLAFFLLLACYSLTARDPGNVLYVTAFLGLLLASLVYGATRYWRVDRAELVLAALCTTGAIISAIAAIYSSANGAARAVGFLMGPNELARLGMILATLGLSALLLTRSRWRYLSYLGGLAAAMVLVLSGTRGALPALPMAGLVMAAFLAFGRQERRHAFWLVVGTVVMTALVIFSSSRFDSLAGTLGQLANNSAGLSDGAVAERLAMLRGAYGAFLQSPWIGVGWANFRPAAALAMDMTRYGTTSGGDFQFHNDVANLAVAAGGIGVLCLAGVLVAPLAGAFAGKRDALFPARLYCCTGLSACFSVFGLTDLNFGYELPTTLYAFLTALVLGCFDGSSKNGPVSAPSNSRARQREELRGIL